MDNKEILAKLDSALKELAESENGLYATQHSEKYNLFRRVERDGYARTEPRKQRGDDTYFIVTSDGSKHYRIGGYRGEIRKERLMTENIEASISSSKVSKRVSVLTLIVAALTLFTLIYQIICS